MNCPYLSGKHCNFMSRNPTYSAFWKVLGVPCLRLQRLTSSVDFGQRLDWGQEEPGIFRPTELEARLLSAMLTPSWSLGDGPATDREPSPARSTLELARSVKQF